MTLVDTNLLIYATFSDMPEHEAARSWLGARLSEPDATLAGELAQTPGLRSDDVPDVEIAALAIEHGLVLATRDRGFRRFSGLRVLDPLSS